MNEYREYLNINVAIGDNKKVEADLSWTYCVKMWRLPQKNCTKNSIIKKKKKQFLVDVLEGKSFKIWAQRQHRLLSKKLTN